MYLITLFQCPFDMIRRSFFREIDVHWKLSTLDVNNIESFCKKLFVFSEFFDVQSCRHNNQSQRDKFLVRVSFFDHFCEQT